MAIKLTGILTKENSGRWKAFCGEIPEIVKYGDSPGEAAKNLLKAIEQYFYYLGTQGELKNFLKKIGKKLDKKDPKFTLSIKVE